MYAFDNVDNSEQPVKNSSPLSEFVAENRSRERLTHSTALHAVEG